MLYRIGIVAHASRLEQAGRLRGLVGAGVISVDSDETRLGCERNHIQVWRNLAAGTSTWSVVLEDDAVPVPNFRDQLTAALSVAPAPYVSLYLGRLFPRHWQRRYRETLAAAGSDTCWAITSGWMLHAVGIAVRTELLPGMVRHLELSVGKPVDEAIGQYTRNTKSKVAYTLPSLVDHADGETIHIHQDGISRPPGRTAWTVGTRTAWDSTTIEMG